MWASDKTEAAVRAAFKAVQDGKTSCRACTTTCSRSSTTRRSAKGFSGFPTKIRAFPCPEGRRKPAITEEIASGAVDVVIGTHRIPGQRSVQGPGLVIIDE